MGEMNEYSKIKEVAIRSPLQGFVSEEKLSCEWEPLRFHAKPHLEKAIVEFNYFRNLLSEEEIEKRKKNVKIPKLINQTPWQEISRKMVGQLETGACLETESIYLDITKTKGMPRHSH